MGTVDSMEWPVLDVRVCGHAGRSPWRRGRRRGFSRRVAPVAGVSVGEVVVLTAGEVAAEV